MTVAEQIKEMQAEQDAYLKEQEVKFITAYLKTYGKYPDYYTEERIKAYEGE
jgi:hypothetical protein